MTRQIQLGGYILNVGLPRNRRTPNAVPDLTGYGIFMANGPDDYVYDRDARATSRIWGSPAAECVAPRPIAAFSA